jgi:hypothetical protein
LYQNRADRLAQLIHSLADPIHLTLALLAGLFLELLGGTQLALMLGMDMLHNLLERVRQVARSDNLRRTRGVFNKRSLL